ncbi:CHAD domain-containing protein [Alloalcanivorax marinus]|uniref:CHAD domain-containing protein n=1 Tax=Alloalcanivorax marinus TaxID=1177169 RepID=UPI0021CF5508|nr:CHAD domain-containing protein [Alloalcanivorax marinus]
MGQKPGDETALMTRLIEAARAQDETALTLLKDQTTLDPDRVHDLRVTVKRLRALWRLMATQGHRKTAEKRDKALRDAARRLSVARDRQVMGETLDALRAGTRRDYEQAAVDAVRRMALPEDQAAVAPAAPEGLETVFSDDRAAWDALTVEEGTELLRKGFGRLYADARQRGFEAIAENRASVWHDFRKSAKAQLYLLDPIADRLDDSDLAIKDLKKLGRRLGELHDLQVLEEFLRQARKEADDKEPFAHVRQMIGRREAAVVEDCEKRTRRFFGPKPKAFRQALRQALNLKKGG